MRRLIGITFLALFTLSRPSHAQDATAPGVPSAPFPTLHNLSVEWPIDGDQNANATVSVRYRAQGAPEFREALPLFRVPQGSNEGFDWSNKLSGSIFGLQPGTSYEIELTLSDPDGGDAVQSLEVATRALPSLPTNPNEITVEPDTLAAALDAAGPGDVLRLEPGSYQEIVIPNDGGPGELLVLSGAPDGTSVVEGDVRIDGRSHVLVEKLVVRGMIKFNDAAFIVIRDNTIETPGDGIVSYGQGVDNAVITGNTILGPTVWQESSLGVDGDNLGEGVVLTGAGNVVSFNRVSGFRDCLSLLEDSEANNQVSNDFYGNDLSVCADDAIEADFAMGNVRVFQNRITDSFMGLSSQPSLGGPTYFIRNVMYNVVFQAFKLQRSSVGDVGLHNTVVKSGDAFSVNTGDVFSRSWFRNNLFLGGPGGEWGGYDSGPGDVLQLPSADVSCSFDYDGYGSIGTGTFQGRVGEVRFASLAELQSSTSEAHAIEVDREVFEDIAFPSDPWNSQAPTSFALAPEAPAIDVGVQLPNVSDGFQGSAPDLGAVELGADEPSYGPGGELPAPDVEPTEPDPAAGGSGAVAVPDAGAPPNASGGGGSGAVPSPAGEPAGGAGSGGTTTGPEAPTAPTDGGGGSSAAPNGDVPDDEQSGVAGRDGAEPTAGDAGDASDGANSDVENDAGCDCRVPARSTPRTPALLVLLGLLAWLRRRR